MITIDETPRLAKSGDVLIVAAGGFHSLREERNEQSWLVCSMADRPSRAIPPRGAAPSRCLEPGG